MYLFPQEFNVSPFKYMHSSKGNRQVSLGMELQSYDNQTDLLIPQFRNDDDITWIG